MQESIHKIAFVFPGQASQYVGMGKDFYDSDPVAKEIFDKANDVLGYDIRDMIFNGTQEQLTLTKFTQPAVFITSIACFRVFVSRFPELAGFHLGESLLSSRYAAGHSLGEYSALVASQSLSYEDGLSLVNKRAEFIQESCEKTKGSMLALLGAEKETVEQICREAGAAGVCEAVNFNAPGQIVISGETPAMEKARQIAADKKIKCVPLAVSGAFHSSLMKEAAEKMKETLKKYTFKNPKFSLITNCDAQLVSEGSQVAEKLTRQIARPVLWVNSIKKILLSDCNTFIEFGPKKVISGMIKQIERSARVFNVENESSLKETAEAIANV